MKPINEMTLPDILEEMRRAVETTPFETRILSDAKISLRNQELADRIDDLTRWIPVEEALPDNGEAVLCRRVEGGMGGAKEIKPQVGTFRNGSFDCVFDWTRVTHWRRIDTP